MSNSKFTFRDTVAFQRQVRIAMQNQAAADEKPHYGLSISQAYEIAAEVLDAHTRKQRQQSLPKQQEPEPSKQYESSHSARIVTVDSIDDEDDAPQFDPLVEKVRTYMCDPEDTALDAIDAGPEDGSGEDEENESSESIDDAVQEQSEGPSGEEETL